MALVFSCTGRLNEVAICFAPMTVIQSDRMSVHLVQTADEEHKSRINVQKGVGFIDKLDSDRKKNKTTE